MRRLFDRLSDLWERHRLAASFAFLFLGSAYDAITLKRVDNMRDNLTLLVWLILLVLTLAVELRIHLSHAVPAAVLRRASWVRYLSQFLFGGLFSAYVVFYSHSTNFGPDLLFTALLVLLLVINELLEGLLAIDLLRTALLAFCAASFFRFFLPVLTGSLFGTTLASDFLAIGVVAMVPLLAMVRPGDPITAEQLAAEREAAERAVREALAANPPPESVDAAEPLPEAAPPGVRPADVFEVLARFPPTTARTATLRTLAVGFSTIFALRALTCAGLVPPVPLALVEAGVFHSVERQPGGFKLSYEPRPWRFWVDDDREFHRAPGETVSVFTATFAPTGMALKLVHHWQHWDDKEGWVTADKIGYQTSGGRNEGFRGWTRKKNAEAGAWRVLVETESGLELGRVRFDITDVTEHGPLETRDD